MSQRNAITIRLFFLNLKGVEQFAHEMESMARADNHHAPSIRLFSRVNGHLDGLVQHGIAAVVPLN
jgi:hypothetical protein